MCCNNWKNASFVYYNCYRIIKPWLTFKCCYVFLSSRNMHSNMVFLSYCLCPLPKHHHGHPLHNILDKLMDRRAGSLIRRELLMYNGQTPSFSTLNYANKQTLIGLWLRSVGKLYIKVLHNPGFNLYYVVSEVSSLPRKIPINILVVSI